MRFRKQSLGIDISKDKFDVKLLALPQDGDRHRIRGSRKFANNRKGFVALRQWLDKKVVGEVSLTLALEATGTYHEELAYFFHHHHYRVVILLPNTVKAFARSHNQYSKTDAVDAELIARLALERSCTPWQPANDSLRQLRQLTRERAALQQDKRRHLNQVHALEHSHHPLRSSLRRHRAALKLIEKQVAAIEKEIEQLRTQDERLDTSMKRLQTIPQVGALTAATVLAETGCFDLFESRAQLVKYAGMDIVARQSGSSVQGRSRLSKRGNSRLRAALHMPAVGMTNRNGPIAEVYRRVLERTGSKMKAVVAVQRKLLVLMYAVHQNQTDYDESIHRMASENKTGELVGSPAVTQSAVAGRSS